MCHKYQLDYANATSHSLILVCIVSQKLFNTHKNIYAVCKIKQSEKLSKCANKSSLHHLCAKISSVGYANTLWSSRIISTLLSNDSVYAMSNMHVQHAQHACPTCATCMSNSWHHQTQAFHFQHCSRSGSSIIVKMKSLLQTIFQSSYMEHRFKSCIFGQGNTHPHTRN